MKYLTPDEKDQIRAMRKEGLKLEYIASKFSVDMSTIHRVAKNTKMRIWERLPEEPMAKRVEKLRRNRELMRAARKAKQ